MVDCRRGEMGAPEKERAGEAVRLLLLPSEIGWWAVPLGWYRSAERLPDRRISDDELASGEALPVLLLLELEPALTLRADGYKMGVFEALRLVAGACFVRAESWDPLAAREGSRECEVAV